MKFHWPYHLIIPVLVSLSSLILILFFRERIFKRGLGALFFLAFSSCLLVYSVYVGHAAISDISLQLRLSACDLDHDGIFSSSEESPKQQKLFHDLLNDTGRNYSFILGIFISGIVFLGVLILGGGIYAVYKLYQKFKIDKIN